MSKLLEVIPFHDHPISTVREGDDVWVALKPLIENIGLDWSGQLQRIKRHPVLSEGMVVTPIPYGHNDQEMVVLELKLLPGYLTTIQSDRITNAEVRERVILFQREAFDVLFQHFFGAKGNSGRQIASSAAEAIKLIEAIKAATLPAEREYLHSMLAQLSEARGLPCPPVEDLVEPDYALEKATELLSAIELAIASGTVPQRHRRDDRLAFSTRDLSDGGIELQRDDHHTLKKHPRFIGKTTVNCNDDHARHCWVFAAPAPLLEEI